MKLYLIFMMSLFLSFASGATIIGSVTKVQGNVKVKNAGSIKKNRVKVGLELQEGDLVTTSKTASSVIELLDGSRVVLWENSSIHFTSIKNAEQLDGKIYYKISSRDAKNSLKIKTPFAIIGIKGTTFVINATKDASVTLSEGVISIRSIKEEFELYRKGTNSAFDKYSSKQKNEFDKYKNADKKYALPIKTKEFDLQAGNRVSFNAQKVKEDAWESEEDDEFSSFEELMGIDPVASMSKKDSPDETTEMWKDKDDAEFDAIESASKHK